MKSYNLIFAISFVIYILLELTKLVLTIIFQAKPTYIIIYFIVLTEKINKYIYQLPCVLLFLACLLLLLNC